MSNKTEKRALVPKRRFPEFREAGEWAIKPLTEVCEKIPQGGTPDTSNPDYWNGSIEWLTPAEMGKLETRFIYSTARKITKTGLQSCSSDLLPINSLILSTRAPIGHLVINKTEMAMNQGCKGLIPNRLTSHDYLYYCLSYNKRSLSDLGAGNTFKELSASSLKNFEIAIPVLPEQQKIADCLASLDERITLEAQKLDTLKTHKKGLMQQLFPAEGETLPKLRFPEFRDAGEWEEKRLGDIGSVRMCKRILKEQTSPRGDIPFYKIGTFGGVPDAYISREIFENFRNSYPFPKNGAVLISAAGTIGRTVRYNGELAYFQDSNIVWLENNENLISDNFLLYLYQLINWAPSVGAIQRLYNENILGAQVKFPSIPEQQKIADCLASLVDLIIAKTQKLAALKTHKEGLMQQLFPVLEEEQV